MTVMRTPSHPKTPVGWQVVLVGLFLVVGSLGRGEAEAQAQPTTSTPAATEDTTASAVRITDHTVIDGPARFVALTPTLLRLEYAPSGDFEEERTFFARRAFEERPRVETTVDDGWRVVRTNALTLRYRRGSGPFDTTNVEVRLTAGADTVRAQPEWPSRRPCAAGRVCQAEDAVLGGTARVNSHYAWYTGPGFVVPGRRGAVRWRVRRPVSDADREMETHAVALRYAAAAGTTAVRLESPAGRADTLRLPPTDGWDNWRRATDTLRVPSGGSAVTVRPVAEDTTPVHLDYLALARPEQAPPEPSIQRTPERISGWRRKIGPNRKAVPMHDGFLRRRGWTLLDDTTTPVQPADSAWVWPRTRPHTYRDGYFFGYGHDYRQGLRDLKRLTGAPPLLPRWAFGVWFSRLHPYSASDYRTQVLPNFRRHKVPLDALIIDTDFKAPDTWRGWNWSPKRYPEPDAFMAWTEQESLQVALNVHPSIGQDDPQFAKAKRIAGRLVDGTGKCPRWQGGSEPCAVWDWGRPAHADSYFAVHRPFEAQGVDFWWLDWCCDASRVTMPGLTPGSWINALYARHREARGRRGFVLSRIGSSWQNPRAARPGPWAEGRSAVHFTGDTFPTWDMLGFQIEFTTREGATGLPYVSHDIGSFHGGGPRAEPVPGPLYARWVQFGTFQPVFRLHGHGRRLPWQYDEPVASIAARFLRLRARLAPYLYTVARDAHDTGLPMVRGLYLQHPERPEAYRHDRQYLLGDDLLVAPVASAESTKAVWFPPGQWTDFFTGEVHHGPKVDTLSVPLDRMPVFARAGAIVPMQRAGERVGTQPPARLTLRVYTGADGQFALYDDAGTGQGYRNGAYGRTRITHRRKARTVTIEGPPPERYPGQPAERGYRLRLVGADRPDTMRVNGRSVPERKESRLNAEADGWTYRPEQDALVVYLAKRPTDTTITFRYVAQP